MSTDTKLEHRIGELIVAVETLTAAIQPTNGGDPARADLPPLNRTAAAVLELLQRLPAHRALSLAEIHQELQTLGIHQSESTLRRHTLPALIPWGLRNTPRIGYSIRR